MKRVLLVFTEEEHKALIAIKRDRTWEKFVLEQAHIRGKLNADPTSI